MTPFELSVLWRNMESIGRLPVEQWLAECADMPSAADQMKYRKLLTAALEVKRTMEELRCIVLTGRKA